MNKTVADLILKQLAAYGVQHIFGVIGDAVFPLADAFSRQTAIRFIPTTIETAAAYAASAYGKSSGKLGVCIGTSGPGAVNLLSGTAEAFLDGAPLLCLTGQVARIKYAPGNVQYLDQRLLFNAVTAQTQSCINPGAAIPALTGLIHQALARRTAVHLEIPTDILAQPTSAEPARPSLFQSDLWGTNIIAGDWETLAATLQGANRPLLVIGKEARPEAEGLLAFAEKWGAGVILTQEAKGALPDRQPLILGGIGEAFLPDCLAEADFILLVGMGIYEQRYFPSGSRVIQVLNHFPATRPAYPAVWADLTILPQRLAEVLSERIPREEWRLRVELSRQARWKLVDDNGDPRHPLVFFRTLAQNIPEDAIITLDVGEFIYWFDTAFTATRQQVLLSSQWRGMGGAIPAGIAACLLYPDRKVISIVGDGGFLMSMGELATAVRNQLPLTVFVLRNNQYGLENQKLSSQGFACFGTDLILPDLIRLAESFGVKGHRIPNQLEGGTAIAEALREAPALVDVEVNSAPLAWL
jgi:pyruvate oxidase